MELTAYYVRDSYKTAAHRRKAPRTSKGCVMSTAGHRWKDVRMRGFQDRTELSEALALVLHRVQSLPAEYVDLHQAAERVLACDVIADVAVPAFDRAAMDGYALRGDETFGAGPYNPLEFVVIGESLPGRPFAGEVQPGQAVRIMTGAALPQGADAVLQVEEIGRASCRERV